MFLDTAVIDHALNRRDFNGLTISVFFGQIQMLDRTIVVLECCAVVGIMLHIEIGDRTTVHREAARIAGRPRIGVYKHVTDRAAVDRSQRAVGIGADPQIGTVLQVLVILIPFSVLVASNAAGLHFKGRAAGHVNAADKVRSLAVRDRRTVDGQLTLITENHAALLIAVNCNIFQRDLAGNVENAVGFVITADSKAVGSLDRVLALTVDGDVLCKIERGGQLRVLQQRDGIAVLRGGNSVSQRLIIGTADLGNCVGLAQFLHGAIGRLHIISGDVLGNVSIKFAAGYRCGTAVGCIVMVHNHFLGIAGVLKFAAGNGQFANGIGIATISRGEQYGGSGIQSLERASSDFSLVPVHNDVLGSIREITAIDGQYTKGIVLDRVDAAGKIAALDRQIAIGSYPVAAIADHAGITASVFNGNASVNLHGTVIGNGVPAVSVAAIGRIGTLFDRTLKGAARKGNSTLIINSSFSVRHIIYDTVASDGQRCTIFNNNGVFTRFVRQCLAVQIKRSILTIWNLDSSSCVPRHNIGAIIQRDNAVCCFRQYDPRRRGHFRRRRRAFALRQGSGGQQAERETKRQQNG